MRMDPIAGTPKAEEVICTAARGDYYDGYVGETDYEEIMESIEGTSIEEKERNLIRQLLDRGHYGPFEHVQMTIAVKDLSRTCMAQITRHRHVSFDVQSQRYVDFGGKDDPSVTPKSLVDPDHFAREVGTVDVNDDVREDLLNDYEDLVDETVEYYERAVEHGIPKEDARFALTEGTKVNLTMSMNARAMLHICNMRGKADAQWEARQAADMLQDIGEHWCPATFQWLDEKGPLKLSP